MNFTSFPPPPPWLYNSKTYYYENEVTGEQSIDHPLQRYFSNRNNDSNLNSTKAESPTKAELKHSSPSETKRVTIDILSSTNEKQNEIINKTSTINEEIGDLNNPLNQESSVLQHKSNKYNDFHCHWKELGLFGDTNTYGLTIRYNIEDGSSIVKFDGVDAKWHMNALEGPYGPIERWDLFIGAKVRIFGRHLTITSANATVCHWNDVQAKKLQKKQEWLRQKIESVGAVPIVRRQVPVCIKHIVRASKAEGRSDLRRLYNENAKLYEQLAKLGLSYTLEKKITNNSIATEKIGNILVNE